MRLLPPVPRIACGSPLTLPRARVTGGVDGSIATIVAVEEDVFKRLQLLQGQLVRSVQHASGLNPRAFRSVLPSPFPFPLEHGLQTDKRSRVCAGRCATTSSRAR